MLYNAARSLELLRLGAKNNSAEFRDGQEAAITLETARIQGRIKSRFLKETGEPAKANDIVPNAKVAFFHESVEPILKKSCLVCHGPDKSEGRLRIDQLNADLLTGADVKRWREVFNALSKSEMPPEDEPDYALADADRGRQKPNPILRWHSHMQSCWQAILFDRRLP